VGLLHQDLARIIGKARDQAKSLASHSSSLYLALVSHSRPTNWMSAGTRAPVSGRIPCRAVRFEPLLVRGRQFFLS